MKIEKTIAIGILLGVTAIFCIAANPIKNLLLQSNMDAAGFAIENLGTSTNHSSAVTRGYVTTNFLSTNATTNFATAGQGALAATALQPGTSQTNISGLEAALASKAATNAPVGGDLVGNLPNPTLATSGVTAGTYGTATNTVTFAVDGKGRVTSISTNAPITPAAIGAATTAQGLAADSALQPGNNVSELVNDLDYVDAVGASASAPVQTVAGRTGTVTLSISDLLGLNSNVLVGRSGSGTGTAQQIALAAGWSATSGTLTPPAASTSQAGVTFFSSTTEVQTGTEQGKAVSPFSLAAWWTAIKTQAQTIAANWTFSGTTALNVASATTATITTGTVGTLSVTGNTTLGDASGDTVAIAGPVTAANATGTGATSIANNGTLDTRFGKPSTIEILSGTVPTNNAVLWERGVTALSGSGTDATLALSVAPLASPVGKLIAIHNATPTSWNGLYACTAWDGTTGLTLTTTKTATYTSGAYASLAKPIAKFTASGVTQWAGQYQWTSVSTSSVNSGRAGSGNLRVEFNTSGTYYSSAASSVTGTDKLAADTPGGLFEASAARVDTTSTVYLVLFRGIYNGNSGDYLRTVTFRFHGGNNGVTVAAPTTDYTP